MAEHSAAHYRADTVGSYLRPDYLRKALDENVHGSELRDVEDRAVREVLAMQDDVGLPVVTDGEFRRRLWYHTILAVADGFDPEGFDRVWTDDSGREVHHGSPVVVSPLLRKARQADVELDFTRRHTALPVKVTMPAPTNFLSYWTEGVSDRAYPNKQAFLDDLVALMNADARKLAAAGAAYLQIDAPKYTFFDDRRMYPDPDRADEQLAELIRTDLRVFEGVSGVTTGVHICRGNYRSMHSSSTPYERFAETLFREARYDRLLLEYDDVRSGGFEPLRFVPDGVTAVLGLVTTKRPDLEDTDELRRAIDDASRYLPLERLALSPQCGFASTYEGNELGPDDQRRKLELVVRTAESVWGTTAHRV
ncbi:MAG: methionine synthase [Pseudonocardiaceae bacterium]|nr:methionine synthase [Pseudonocardiaceae bacterium]